MALLHVIVFTIVTITPGLSSPFFTADKFNSALSDVYELYNSTAELINGITNDKTDILKRKYLLGFNNLIFSRSMRYSPYRDSFQLLDPILQVQSWVQ